MFVLQHVPSLVDEWLDETVAPIDMHGCQGDGQDVYGCTQDPVWYGIASDTSLLVTLKSCQAQENGARSELLLKPDLPTIPAWPIWKDRKDVTEEGMAVA